jgi:hypothetical protein
MKKMISRVKNLSQKAAQLKAAMEKAPATVAELREAVAATTGQLQQLRTEVQSSATALTADNESRLSQALQEINASQETFLEAGYEVSGVDLEISPVQRLLVHLNKLEDVHPSMLRSLLSSNQQRRTTHALLSALVQAQRMADTVELTKLDYRELIVGLGPIPSIRLCWRGEEVFEAEDAAAPAQAAPSPAAAPVRPPYFGKTSFFERRASQSSAVSAEPSAAPPPAGSPETPAEPESTPVVSGTSDWRQEALDRLKKTPHVSKYHR